MRNWKLGLIGLGMLAISMQGCSKEEPDNPNPVKPPEYTRLKFIFTPTVNGVPLDATDTIRYVNKSENVYSVAKMKFLVSDVRLNDWEYSNHQIGEYHLVDVSDPTTLSWKVKDSIKAKDYANVSLFLGFRQGENKAGDYPDLDKANWAAPLIVGGYYTFYMEGRYNSTPDDNNEDPYNMAVCGNKKVETQTDTTWKPNELVASLPNSGFPLKPGTGFIVIEIRFDINKLFEDAFGNPNYNLDEYTSNIEDDATGTAILSTNFVTAFSFGAVGYNQDPGSTK